MKTTDKMVLFWGGVFSQWYPHEIVIGKVKYNCAEQYMMAMKAEHFGDMEAHKKIMESEHPRDQKRFGRKVKGFDARIWAEIAKDVVFNANMAKFNDPELRPTLLGTGDREIVEASPYDVIWGIGLGEEDPDALDKSKWRGTNWLGEVLMEVRDVYNRR
jgi:ribA/ribD-fused uncharacterized protein